ncbi:MAG TPA: winged helix-turn-helix domain-containing protein, partial [Tahibacter sp.]|nr:winged helix-turn-helix domain-containing protein [Tahibacter sp.]
MPDNHSGTSSGNARSFKIGTIIVDASCSRLLRDGRDLALPPRASDLLALFLSRPGELLTRDDIFRCVWKDVLVEDANLTQTVWLLRRALGEEGKHWIRTVSRRGYVFEGPRVEPFVDPADAAAPP